MDLLSIVRRAIRRLIAWCNRGPGEKDLSRIVRCAIHPAIGIARVGNSPDRYFYGPDVPDASVDPGGSFKDEQHRVKRQVARFRVYGYDADGKVVAELTAKDATIAWKVHLANSKANWYRFDRPMDIDEAENRTSPRRNLGYRELPGVSEADLVIDAGEQCIAGDGQKVLLDQGAFMGSPVLLGELQTDGDGRLLVLGGRGRSLNPREANRVSFTVNNDGWSDDTSDGPVTADVTVNGCTLTADPAWVVVAPPNYAPGFRSVVTMYDVAYQVAVDQMWLTPPTRVSFTRQIYPIFQSMSQLQWVNAGFYLQFGWGAPLNFMEPTVLARLADPGLQALEFRTSIFERFSRPNYPAHYSSAEVGLPPIYGDAFDGDGDKGGFHERMTLTRLQYGWLKQWATGDFDADWDPDRLPPSPRIEDIELQLQPAALDQAALEGCEGGPFHPGVEMSWPMRHGMLYSAPFRIKLRPDRDSLSLPTDLTQSFALSESGPLNGSGPGDLTRWLGVPWQADTALCRSGYTPGKNAYLPTYWPARVPNHVLSEYSYDQIGKHDLGQIQRIKFLCLREDWLRNILLGDAPHQLAIGGWHRIGILVRKPGPSDASEPGSPFPTELYVEEGNMLDHPATPTPPWLSEDEAGL